MNHQPDMLGLELDASTMSRIPLPQAREVRRPKLRDVLGEASRVDVGHEIRLPERARSDHR